MKSVSSKSCESPSLTLFNTNEPFLNLSDLVVAERENTEKLPEANMWLKCLMDGISNFLKGPSTKSFEYSENWLAEAYWLLCCKDDTRVGSFIWICDSVGVDPEWLRRKVLSLYPNKKGLEHLDSRTVTWR